MNPAAIVARARRAGVVVSEEAASGLAAHAALVLGANARLHLTTITEPTEFLERQLGEAFEGAAMIDGEKSGVMLDLGSGNGYPGIPFAHARPGLQPILAEASAKKAAFLREALSVSKLPVGRVVEAHVARAADLVACPSIDVLLTRAMGGWERVVPKLVPRMADDASILIWASAEASAVFSRRAWAKLELAEQRMLPGRERSLIYLLRVVN